MLTVLHGLHVQTCLLQVRVLAGLEPEQPLLPLLHVTVLYMENKGINWMGCYITSYMQLFV